MAKRRRKAGRKVRVKGYTVLKDTQPGPGKKMRRVRVKGHTRKA